jgi:DNA-binding transcriptional ArsR family regulator
VRLVTAALAAQTFAALGEPTRLRIVELLGEGPRSVGEIVEQLDIRQPQASKHLRVLTGSGLVDVEARHRHRIYSLRREPFTAVTRWAESFEHLWETRLDSLGALLESLDPSSAPSTHPDPTPKATTPDQADR